ncbi:uncharacterized protein LOC133644382 [Entelurus aequoreus]|uniref:uncharacterized protein LOC133644382 n=1 Tax=Entelurus aequoreus TaxID=161455 RepID=UPI002B1E5F8D|nr:uncharacterized protein LOC133644382 [Entelurus aequoreus]
MILQALFECFDLSSLLLFAFVVLLLTDVVRNWRPGSFPPGPWAVPFLGNVFTRTDYKTMENLAKEYGPVFSLRKGSERMVFVWGYKMVKEALVTQLDSFVDRPVVQLFHKYFKGMGIVMSNGYLWKNQRKFANTHLRNFGGGHRSLENYIEAECHFIREAFKEEQGKPFDPMYIITNAVSNIISSVLFGRRFEYSDGTFRKFLELDNEAIALATAEVVQLCDAFPRLLNYLPGPHKKVHANYRDIMLFLQKEVEKHREEWNPEEPRDYIDVFLGEIEKRKEDPQAGFNIESLVVSTLDMVEAGTETSATTLRWALVYMLHYPEIQEEVQAEIDRVIGQARQPTLADRPNMPYTEAVIHETLRMGDIIPLGFPKMASHDATLGGYVIPKGTAITTILTSVLYDKSEWETPDRFNPQHFLGSEGQFRRRNAFLPFSAGKRSCLGEQLARMELFLFFTTLMQHFTFTAIPGEMPNLEGVMGFTHSPGQFRLLAVPRASSTLLLALLLLSYLCSDVHFYHTPPTLLLLQVLLLHSSYTPTSTPTGASSTLLLALLLLSYLRSSSHSPTCALPGTSTTLFLHSYFYSDRRFFYTPTCAPPTLLLALRRALLPHSSYTPTSTGASTTLLLHSYFYSDRRFFYTPTCAPPTLLLALLLLSYLCSSYSPTCAPPTLLLVLLLLSYLCSAGHFYYTPPTLRLHSTMWASALFLGCNMWALLLSGLALLLAVFYFKQKERCDFPPGPPALPVFGNVFHVAIKQPHRYLTQLAQNYGDVFCLRLGSERWVFVCGWKMLREVLVTQAHNFADRPRNPVLARMYPPSTGGLLASSGEVWRSQRHFAMATLRRLGLSDGSIESNIWQESQHLQEAVEQQSGEPFDPASVLNSAAANIICQLVFGKRFDYHDRHLQQLHRGLADMIYLEGSVWARLYDAFPGLMEHLPGPHNRMFGTFRALQDFIACEMEKHKLDLDCDKPGDYMDAFLLETRDKENAPLGFDEENLVLCCLDLFVAGTETVSKTLQWGLVFLIKHPEVQNKVQEEIERVLGTRGPTMADRTNMPYTNAVIHEIQRMANVVPLNGPRVATKDTQLGGYTIPKGSNVLTILTSVLFDQNQWETPQVFNPGHFLDADGSFVKKKNFIPFSAGKRVCIGESLAKMEVFLFLTSLLQKFTFWTLAEEQLSYQGVVGLTHSPHPFRVYAHAR